jgi:aspartate racemase
MEQDVYRGRLTERHGLQAIVPDAADRETVHWVIYEELCLGQVREGWRSHYRRIIQRGVASPCCRTQ